MSDRTPPIQDVCGAVISNTYHVDLSSQEHAISFLKFLTTRTRMSRLLTICCSQSPSPIPGLHTCLPAAEVLVDLYGD